MLETRRNVRVPARVGGGDVREDGDLRDCGLGGRCSDDKCTSYGTFSRERCEVDGCKDVKCQNGEKCGDENATCTCKPGFKRDLCEYPLAKTVQNGKKGDEAVVGVGEVGVHGDRRRRCHWSVKKIMRVSNFRAV
jgi:hypothetical protein